MKLIVLSDPRGSHAELYILLKETIADAYLVCGDLIDGPFYSDGASAEFTSLRDDITALARERGPGPAPLIELASALAGDPSSGEDTREKARAFLEFQARALKASLQKYQVLENIFTTKPYAALVALPGPGDMDLPGTPLRERSLHGMARAIGPLVVAGLGGTGSADAPLPRKKDIGRPSGEDLDALISRNPHVLAVHEQWTREEGGAPASWTAGIIPLTFIFSGGTMQAPGMERNGPAVTVRLSGFGSSEEGGRLLHEGGFFHECLFNGTSLEKITLKKLVGERVIDLAEYTFPAEGPAAELVLDPERLAAMKERRVLDGLTDAPAHVPEIRLFRDIRNYFRIHQTQETERRVDLLQKAIDATGVDGARVALDLVGSTNVGLSGKSSDVDMVFYLRAGEDAADDDTLRREFDAVEEKIRENLGGAFDFEVIDRINLDRVAASIRERNFECDAAQLFVTYRSACRPVNYRVVSPVEDLLNRDPSFRSELEERMRSYLRMFARTSDNSKSFEKYLNRLKTSGVAIPAYLEKKINLMLQKKKP
jgi:hypothetical protein